MTHVAGVDIGRYRDRTAVVRLEDGVVTAAVRFATGMSWPKIMAGVIELTRDCDCVAVDRSGIGDALASALERKLPGRVVPVVFTARTKAELVVELVAAIRERRIRVAAGAQGADDLRAELVDFRSMPTRTGWTYEAKAGQHDDLVVALALALKGAEISSRANAPLPSLLLPSPGPPRRI